MQPEEPSYQSDQFEVMQSLSLNDLGQSAHPLLEPGDFSIFSDPNVSHTTMVERSYDLDGVCLATR